MFCLVASDSSLACPSPKLDLPHAACLALPRSMDEARAERLKQRHGETLQRVVRGTLSLAGGGMALLPYWPQGFEVSGAV